MSDTKDKIIKKHWDNDEILTMMNQIIRESKTQKMEELKKLGKLFYLDNMIKLFPDFFESFPYLFEKICWPMNNDDMKQIAEMLVMRDRIKNKNISKKRGEYILGEDLAKRFAPGLLDKNRVMPD